MDLFVAGRWMLVVRSGDLCRVGGIELVLMVVALWVYRRVQPLFRCGYPHHLSYALHYNHNVRRCYSTLYDSSLPWPITLILCRVRQARDLPIQPSHLSPQVLGVCLLSEQLRDSAVSIRHELAQLNDLLMARFGPGVSAPSSLRCL